MKGKILTALILSVSMLVGLIPMETFAASISATAGTSMYRLYNKNTGEHFYTGSVVENDYLASIGWTAEGIAWSAPSTGLPVYRLFNPNTGEHHYTTAELERDACISYGWNYEGIGWYTNSSGVPVYRLYNPVSTNAGSHHYTKDTGERDALSMLGWNYEGIAWYGMDSDTDNTDTGKTDDGNTDTGNTNTDNTVKKLSAAECAAKVDELRKTNPVQRADANVLRTLADFDINYNEPKSGVLLSEASELTKYSIRSVLLEAATYPGGGIEGTVSYEMREPGGYWSGEMPALPLDAAKKLFKEVYGEENFIPTDLDIISNGYIFARPDAHGNDCGYGLLDEKAIIYEDESYILLIGASGQYDNIGSYYNGYNDVLFVKNPESRYGVTVLYVRNRNESIKVASVDTSSELPASNGLSYSGKNLVDGDYKTVWSEGVSGTGVGETITLHLANKQLVRGVAIHNGNVNSGNLYLDNGRVNSVNVNFGNGYFVSAIDCDDLMYWVAYDDPYITPDSYGRYCRFIDANAPILTDTITITITGASSGNMYDNTCIHEIIVY